MPASTRDRFTPTAVGLVSRGWVIDEVERRVAEPERRTALIEELVGYEPPRRHGVRNMFLFWAGAIGASGIAGALDLPRWIGFCVALALFTWLARELATRALRWRLEKLIAGEDSV